MISRRYDVCVGKSNVHVLVDVVPSQKTFNVSYHRTLPFYSPDNEHHPDTLYINDCNRVNPKIYNAKDAYTAHVYNHTPYIALAISSVVKHYPRGVMTDVHMWKTRIMSTGNSMCVDDNTEDHLRIKYIFNVATLPLTLRNKFCDYWMRFIWTCPSALQAIYETIETIPKQLSIKSMGKFMKDVKFTGCGSKIPPKDWPDMMKFMASVNIFNITWMVGGNRIVQEMKQVVDDYSAVILEHDTIKKTTLAGIGLTGDFTLKIPMDQYDVKEHRLVNRTKGFYYVRTDEAENAYIRFENYKRMSMESFRARVDDSLLDAFATEYNERIRRLIVLCALVIMRERLHTWDGKWTMANHTDIRDLRSLNVMIPSLDVTPNDFTPINKKPIVIHGLMAAGKTTYLISVGLAIYLGQVGWPYLIASNKTQSLNPYSAIVIVKNHDGDVFRKRSAFQKHVSQLSYALNHESDALLLFDEPAASTQFTDAKIVIEDILKYYRHHQLVISTHTLIDSTDIARQSMTGHRLIMDWSKDRSTLMDWFNTRPEFCGSYMDYLRERAGDAVTKRTRTSIM